ncbi:unnamed protein product [Blepharisma stoltei]|uniref:Acyltransferase 3 domain-containing protein n=1 Tax=Blepharisma stoltei TaxID=1481888 RepID=A0AAU9IVK1_9CILI|nr:unnamed protein product [Blepharisma stoltei]
MKLTHLFLLMFLSSPTQSDYATCVSELKSWVKGIPGGYTGSDDKYSQMVAYSGKGLNDLGLYYECTDLEGANYVIFQLSQIPALVFGFCFPEECTIDDYWEIINEIPKNTTSAELLPYISQYFPHSESTHKRILADQGFEINLSIHFPENSVKTLSDFTAGSSLMLIFVILLLAACISATSIEIYRILHVKKQDLASTIISENSILKYDPERISFSSFIHKESEFNNTKAMEILLCFSWYSNIPKLLSVKTKEKKSVLDTFNALRVFSILWIILGHTELYRLYDSVDINIDRVQVYFKKTVYTLLFSAPYAVDTFFWIAGFLQSYVMINYLISKPKVNWFMIFMHRYIRIFPFYIFIICIGWTFSQYIGDGPKWYNAEEILHRDCKDWFWTVIIFINNFYMPTHGSMDCLVGEWYIANDMQFFLISLPIIYLYTKISRIFGWVINIFLTVMSFIASFAIAFDENFNTVLFSDQNKRYMEDLYYKPYCRIAPYAIGMITGFIYYTSKNDTDGSFDYWAYRISFKIKKNKWIRYILYFFGAFLMNFYIWIQYDAFQDMEKWSRVQNSLYLSTNRIAWGLSLTLVMLPILLGHNKAVSSILSSNFWAPLGKLAFGVFLCHMIIGRIIFFSQGNSYYLGQLNFFIDAIVITVLAFLLNFILSLLVEIPVLNLERVILKTKD